MLRAIDYWDPKYAAIEAAYQDGDEEEFQREIVGLVDNILHD